MTLLPVPLVDQQTPITEDGKPSENKAMDCVAASICAVLLFLEGKKAVDHEINPDALKDAAYNDQYLGGTDATRYIAPLEKIGYRLYPIQGTPEQLIQMSHDYIENKKQPVIFTQIDPYVPASYGWTHVCTFVGSQNGELTDMDSWAVRYITKSDGEWLHGPYPIVGNQIWILEKIDDMSININSPDVSNYFEEIDASHWHCKKTNKLLAYGMLSCYKATNGLVTLGLPLAGEISIENVHPSFAHLAGHSITIQPFERGVLAYDPEHLIDRPPQSGNVYRLHLYDNGPGTDKRLWDMQAQISQLTTQLQAEQHKMLPPDPVVAHKTQLFDQIKTLANS